MGTIKVNGLDEKKHKRIWNDTGELSQKPPVFLIQRKGLFLTGKSNHDKVDRVSDRLRPNEKEANLENREIGRKAEK